MSNIIPAGGTLVNSADFTITDPPTSIYGAGSDPANPVWTAQIQIKNEAGVYVYVDAITSDHPLFIVRGPGTYRVQRPANSFCSVDLTAGTAGGGGGGGGPATIADGADVAFGARADAPASADTGSFSFIALFKRQLAKLTTISGQLTAMALQLPATLGAKTSALSLSVTPATDSLFAANTLRVTGVSRQLAVTAASINIALTGTTQRISIYAQGADMCYRHGAGAQVAVVTDAFIAQGERLDIGVGTGDNIAAISAGTAAGTLRITELL